MSEMREIRIQTDPNAVTRTETFNGIEYLVAPVIMLCEGVLQGANADNPEYCTVEAMDNVAGQWNGRPVVMNHPKVQGTFVSANSPAVLETWAFGYVFNAHVDSAKLKGEAWLDTARAAEFGGDFQDAIDRINNNEVVEVSTGLFCDIIPLKGRFNNQAYTGVWTNVVSDHLAILSAGIIGACSVEGGCGIPRINKSTEGPWGAKPQDMRINTAALRTIIPNHESHDGHCCETCKGAAVSGPKTNKNPETPAEAIQLVEPTAEELIVLEARAEILVNAIPDTLTNEDASKLLRAALATKLGRSYVYVQAMTRDLVVYEQYEDGYCCGGGGYKSWQQGYDISDDNKVTFVGDPVEVVLTTKITPVVNESEGVQLLDGDAPSVQQEGDDMSQGSGQDGKPTGTSVPVTGAPTEVTPTPSVQSATAAPAAVAEAPKEVTVDVWLANAPPEIAALMRAQMSAGDKVRSDAITSIKANSANSFSDEKLESLDLETLQGLAQMSLNAASVASDDLVAPGMGRFNYGGRGGLSTSASDLSDEDKQRVNSDTNKYGGANAPTVFAAADQGSFGTRVGAFRKN